MLDEHTIITYSSEIVGGIVANCMSNIAKSSGERVMIQALAYMRTSSAANVGDNKDSAQRQRLAISQYAEANGYQIVKEYYDAAVSGADHIHSRDGFSRLLAYAEESEVRVVLVENASRFARDLIVQETGYQLLTKSGIKLIAADDPDAFTSETPTAVMVRQILGSVAQFEKANLVAKLRGARDRKSDINGHRIEGRKPYTETNPELVHLAKKLHRRSPKTGKRRTLNDISLKLAEYGFLNGHSKPFHSEQVRRLVAV